MGGYDPYSNSKGCSELVTAAFRSSYFNPAVHASHGVALASARAGNVIGGGDWALDRLIPDIVRAVEEGREVLIRSPQAIRPWQHVLEPLSGYLKLAEKLYAEGARFAEAWNFGPHDHDAKPVRWIVEELTKVWGDGASYRIETSATNPHEAQYLKLDCSKAHMQLGWQPRWDLRTTLEKICVWHKAQRTGAEMQTVTLQQIKEYEAA
jgi:CDP-glucose 4,6-dehydratase